jgi:hypothetical protein
MAPSLFSFVATAAGTRTPVLLALLLLATARGAAAAEWTRKGCFLDGPQRLPLLGARGNDGSFDSCRASAEASGFNTFGLQYYGCALQRSVHGGTLRACVLSD